MKNGQAYLKDLAKKILLRFEQGNMVTICIPDKSGIQMVDLCPVFRGCSENRTEKIVFMVENVCYWIGPHSHVTLPYEYQTYTVGYSDDY